MTRHPSAAVSAGRSSTPTRASAGGAAPASHLSIGEVLGLLLEEFPDVTISKIRFLESQGLIAPERNPSGYRKFFDEDVELLRVILREQRENYLPLRVIKDRIDSGEIDPSGEHTVPRGIGNVEARSDADSGTDEAHSNGNASAGPVDDADGHHASDDVSEPDMTGDDVPAEDDVRPAASAPPPERATAAAVAPPSGPVTARTTEPEVSSDPTPRPSPPPAPTAPATSGSGHATPPAGPPATPAPQPAQPTATVSQPPLMTGMALTLGELSGMVGATTDEIRQLHEYGIVASREAHGEQLYDESAVEIVQVGVQFLRAGVDARHLRGWKTAADREASLYEQLIMPLLRQRNPRGRQQARDQVQHLNELGARLRAAMMRAALRDDLA